MTTVDPIIPKYTKSNLPDGFKLYKKRTLTPIVRIAGPFIVETLEGNMLCKNGYLALDALGNPYPIDYDVFYQTYEPVDGTT